MIPYLDTMRERIKGLPARFVAQYAHTKWWSDTSWHQGGSAKMCYERLMRLDLETCSLEDLSNVASFLPGWVTIECDSCRMRNPEAVVFGDDYDDEEPRTARICRDCIRRGCEALGVPLLVSGHT